MFHNIYNFSIRQCFLPLFYDLQTEGINQFQNNHYRLHKITRAEIRGMKTSSFVQDFGMFSKIYQMIMYFC